MKHRPGNLNRPVARGAPLLNRPIARGIPLPSGELQIICAFDEDTFAEVRNLAERANISFRAQIRLLVEFGLEDVKAASQAAE